MEKLPKEETKQKENSNDENINKTDNEENGQQIHNEEEDVIQKDTITTNFAKDFEFTEEE